MEQRTVMGEANVNMVVVAHPDDEVLGFGATGSLLVDRGEIVQPVILCGGVDARTKRPTSEELFADLSAANALLGFALPVLGDFPNIRMNTVDHLAVVRFIEDQIIRFRPSRIVTHHPGDLNDDHKQIHGACLAAARLFQRRDEVPPLRSLLLMEVPSSTDWGMPSGGEPFRPNTFVEIGSALDRKLAALRCYRNVMRPYPHSRSEEALRGLAAMRGAQAGLDRAEAFEMVFTTGLN